MFDWLGKVSRGFERLGDNVKKGWETVGGHLKTASGHLFNMATILKYV